MSGLLSSQLRAGHPDFLDLPWELPFAAWGSRCDRLEQLPRGESRHPVLFVGYDGGSYALKQMAPGKAQQEYALLREMQDLALPVVTPVGHLDVGTEEGPASVLITRFLDHSLPYHALFLQSDLARYRGHLLDALASLLVQLHLAGVYWGDCSLFNTLFRRDAGALQAYLVDAETSEVRGGGLSELRRAHDIDLMEENVGGGLLDMVALGALPADYDAGAVAADVRARYDALWSEVSREVDVSPSERYRITERVRALNRLGFTVGEISLAPVEGQRERLRMRVAVTDRSFNRRMLHSLTGLEVEEHQAQQLVNEIQEVRATLAHTRSRSVSLSAAAYDWLESRYRPLTRQLAALSAETAPAELYCQLLEHKWLPSERAQHDVGHDAALEDLLAACEPDVTQT